MDEMEMHRMLMRAVIDGRTDGDGPADVEEVEDGDGE